MAEHGPSIDVLTGQVATLLSRREPAGVDELCRRHRTTVWENGPLLGVWGLCLLNLRRPGDAVGILRRGMELSPESPAIRLNLSAALAAMDEGEEAVRVYAGVTVPWAGGDVPPIDLDQLNAIAIGYDEGDLHRSFSERLLRLHLDAFPARRLGRVLELGCGTGLLAMQVPATATELVGIDRSPAMLEQARAKGLYSRLIEGDLPDALDGVDGPFDSILSSCAMYYFADLAPFFRHAARLLRPGGAFLFSVDPLPDGACEIAVTGPGEFAHSRAYLRRLARDHGFREKAIEIGRHRGPPGFWCAFQK